MNKLTDAEIVKALECCITNRCDECLIYKECHATEKGRADIVLDLINRQKAEIERLQKERIERIRELTRAVYDEEFSKAKAEALKKFAEKLKQRQHLDKDNNAVISVLDVNEVLKEMGKKNEY